MTKVKKLVAVVAAVVVVAGIFYACQKESQKTNGEVPILKTEKSVQFNDFSAEECLQIVNDIILDFRYRCKNKSEENHEEFIEICNNNDMDRLIPFLEYSQEEWDNQSDLLRQAADAYIEKSPEIDISEYPSFPCETGECGLSMLPQLPDPPGANNNNCAGCAGVCVIGCAGAGSFYIICLVVCSVLCCV